MRPRNRGRRQRPGQPGRHAFDPPRRLQTEAIPCPRAAMPWPKHFDVSDTVRMQLCVGTPLAIILPTLLRSYRAHLKHGLVIGGCTSLGIADNYRRWGWFVRGSVRSGVVFKIAFVIIAAIHFLKSVSRRSLATQRRTTRPAGHDRLRLRNWAWLDADGR